MDLFEQLFHLHDPQKPLYQEKLLFYTFQRAQIFSSTAPNTMICGAVYTKRVRKNNTSKILTSISLYPCTFINSMLFSNSKDILCHPPPSPPSPPPQRDATPRANTAAGYITAGYITDPDAHGDLQAIST